MLDDQDNSTRSVGDRAATPTASKHPAASVARGATADGPHGEPAH